MKGRQLEGDRLNGYRASSGLTYQELIRRSGVPKGTVERYMQDGKRGYEATHLAYIIQAINERRAELGLRPIQVADVLVRERITLAACLADFLGWKPHATTRALELQIIAIDMNGGWENLLYALDQSPAESIRVDLLMLGSRVTGLELLSKAVVGVVKSWSQAADGQFEMIRGKFRLYQPQDKVRLEIRRYGELPTFHGVRVKADMQVRYYVTQCVERKLLVPDYSWGEHEYMIIDSSDLGDRAFEYRDRFDNLFDKSWETAQAGTVLGC
jgi:hypothetical protein